MRTRTLLAMAAVSMFVVAMSLTAEDKKDELAGLKCPISGKKVVAESATDYKGGKVYFCCTNCPKGFAANTEKFAAKANHQLVASGQAKQEKCPLTGRDLNPAQSVTIGGVDVTFCCGGCKGKVAKAEGAAQAELVFSDKAFDKGFNVAKKEQE